MNSTVFRATTPCSSVKVKWRFGLIFRLHIGGENVSQKSAWIRQEGIVKVITTNIPVNRMATQLQGNIGIYDVEGSIKTGVKLINRTSICALNMVNKSQFMLQLHALVHSPFLHLFAVKYFRKNLRGTPVVLRDNTCGILPIRRIQRQRFNNGECLLISLWPPIDT
jgi:predicted transcriptional regulator